MTVNVHIKNVLYDTVPGDAQCHHCLEIKRYETTRPDWAAHRSITDETKMECHVHTLCILERARKQRHAESFFTTAPENALRCSCRAFVTKINNHYAGSLYNPLKIAIADNDEPM